LPSARRLLPERGPVYLKTDTANAKETLSQQAAGNYTLIEIKLTERSDIHKSSIFNSGCSGLGLIYNG
jgi:hypothetical protein